MTVQESKQSEIGDESLIGLSAQLKSLSEEENNSHGDKDNKSRFTNPKTGGSFLWLVKEGKNIPSRYEGKLSDFNDQAFCVVCGRPAKHGNFCSMACQGEQYGI